MEGIGTWDPDHDPSGGKVERRAIQLGLRGAMLAKYAREWLSGIEDISGFVAEQLTFMGAWRSAHGWWLFPAVAGTFLTAVYALRVTKQIFWGPPSPHFHHLEDARGPEWVAIASLWTRST